MPAVADLVPITAALFWAACCIAGALLIRAIGHLLPNISILGIGLDFERWFDHAAGGLENWLVDQSKGAWQFATDLWHVTAHVLSTAFGDVVSAIQHTGDNIAYIATQVVPNAIRAAEGSAAKHAQTLVNNLERDMAGAYNAATGGFDHAARAAWEHAAHDFTNVENNLLALVSHGVDSAIGYTDGAISSLKSTLEGELHDAVKTVEGDIGSLHKLLAAQISDLANTVAADYASAKQVAQADANEALTTAKGLIDDARTYAKDVAAADAGAVQDALNRAVATIDGTVSSLTTTVGQDFTAAETQARNEVATAVSTVTGQLNSAVNTLNGAISTAAAAAQAGITGAVNQAQADANQALDSATGTIESVLGGIAQDITAGAQIYNGDLSGTASAVALAITGAIAGVTARVAKLEQCSVGVCSDSPNNFSSLLKDAFGLAATGDAFAYLAGAVTDPSRAAAEAAGLIKPVADTSVKLLDTLLGLPAL